MRRRWRNFAERTFRPRLLEAGVEHVHGPEVIEYEPDEVLLTCLVRNGERQIRSFLDHHFGLGVRHVVFLDNGSSDRTIDLACQYDDVTVIHSNRPFAPYETVMRRYLAHRFSPHRWNLSIDIDERFDFPFSNRLGLRGLLAYLDTHSFTAVVAQMLDLFTAKDGLEIPDGADPAEWCRLYDISNVRSSDYFWGTPSNPAVKAHRGGIRAKVFGTDHGLSKAALAFVDDEIELFTSWHHVLNARIADFTAVLLHYPFVDFRRKVEDVVRTWRYGIHSVPYVHYLEGLERHAERKLPTPHTRTLTNIDELIDEGFLVVSDAYRSWAASWRG